MHEHALLLLRQDPYNLLEATTVPSISPASALQSAYSQALVFRGCVGLSAVLKTLDSE